MDPIEKAKQGMGGLERAVFNLPGVKGYREKEMRRDADKDLRENLARQLEARRRRLTDAQQDLLSGGGLLWLDDFERVASRLQLMIDRVRTASYGYAPFFDIQKVDEAELDRLAAFDQALFDTLPRLDEALAGVQTAVAGNAGVKEALQALSDRVSEMNDTFGHRAEVLQAGE